MAKKGTVKKGKPGGKFLRFTIRSQENKRKRENYQQREGGKESPGLESFLLKAGLLLRAGKKQKRILKRAGTSGGPNQPKTSHGGVSADAASHKKNQY